MENTMINFYNKMRNIAQMQYQYLVLINIRDNYSCKKRELIEKFAKEIHTNYIFLADNYFNFQKEIINYNNQNPILLKKICDYLKEIFERNKSFLDYFSEQIRISKDISEIRIDVQIKKLNKNQNVFRVINSKSDFSKNAVVSKSIYEICQSEFLEVITAYINELAACFPELSNLSINKQTNENESECLQKKVFISYSYDNEQHQKWVEDFATKLKENGIEVIFDKWELKLGQLLTDFMEQSVENAERIICVLTQNYKRKTDKTNGGVGYETSIVKSEILQNGNTTKFIPLLREGNDDVIPISLKGRKYLDMRNDDEFENKFQELMKDLNN